MKCEHLNIGIVKQQDGSIDAGIYDYPHKRFSREFCAEHENNEVMYALPLEVCGQTYAERKANLRELAIEAQSAICDAACYSMGELISIENFFYRNGKRYGLLTEFHENAIC